MANDIVVLKSMGDALRHTGYKNLESAVSEIIDNSLEAKAKDVFIIISEKHSEKSHRKCIDEFAFLDNGMGMDDDKLGSCLAIGYTTHEDRKGMGRFGVGLPQSSLFVTPIVEVYSWQDGIENCKMVYLDINKVKTGEQDKIPDPIPAEIPEKYRKFLKYKITEDKEFDFTKHGTLVYWKNCDNVVPKTMNSVVDRLDFTLGQKFRYLIRTNKATGKYDSAIHILNAQASDPYRKKILPNDPLFLMEENYVLGDKGNPGLVIKPGDTDYCKAEPIFEPYSECAEKDIPVKYLDPKTGDEKDSKVTLKFSIVKKEFYDQTASPGDPGKSKLGQYAAKMEGVSVVRAKREIDFGHFDFYSSINSPYHRWWGCEISFDPELDETFGVANNKQHVDLNALNRDDYRDEAIQPIWILLEQEITKILNEMVKKNKKTRAGSRSTLKNTSPTEELINKAESKDAPVPLPELTESDINRAKENLKDEGIEDPTDDDVRAYFNNQVNIQYDVKSEKNPFFDSETIGGKMIALYINRLHPFYKHFIEPLETQTDENGENNADPNLKITLELLFAAFVKAQHELKEEAFKVVDEFITDWDYKLRKYINEQYKKD